jgi:hypothetical protein
MPNYDTFKTLLTNLQELNNKALEAEKLEVEARRVIETAEAVRAELRAAIQQAVNRGLYFFDDKHPDPLTGWHPLIRAAFGTERKR